MAKYKILRQDEEGKNIIEKSGIKQEFTVEEMKANAVVLLKIKKEVEANLNLKKAECTNIEQNHPELFELPPEKRFAIHMHWVSHDQIKPHEDKLEEINEILDRHYSELNEISKQTGVSIE